MIGGRIAVVIPFYNGYETIAELVGQLRGVGDLEIIVVNDSGDSANRLESILENEAVQILDLNGNFGQHYATIAGISKVEGNHVITMDEDLQHRPETITELIQKHVNSGAEVVYADRTRPPFKRIVHEILATVIFRNAPRTTCSFRLIDKSIVHQIQRNNPRFYQLEGMIMSLRPTYGYVDIEDGPSQRRSGSSYSVLGVFLLLSSLIAFYSKFPWVWLNALLFIVATICGMMGDWIALFCSIPLVMFSLTVLGNHIFALNQSYPKFEDLTIRHYP